MANSITGRVIAVSKVQTVASSDPSKAPLKKRSIYIDCTRYDPYTGKRSEFENKPVLEFSGDKILERVNQKLDAIQQNDIVTVSFDVQGTSYIDKATNKTKNFTGLRAYDVAVTRKADGSVPTTAQVAPQMAQQPAQQAQVSNPFPPADNAPAGGENDLPF
jgi:hypothetical protein